MKRDRQDSSYNLLHKQSSVSVMSNQNRASNATLRSKDSQIEARQMLRQTGNSMSNSSISEKRNTMQNQHSYGQMTRAASALEGQLMAKTGSSAFIGKTMLDRSNRSGAHKNRQMLQSHYGLNSNQSAFVFRKQSKSRGLHSNSKNQAVQKYEDHSALKQFAIEQLSLITQSQYRDEEQERQNILQSDRPAPDKSKSHRNQMNYEHPNSDLIDRKPKMLRVKQNSQFLKNLEHYKQKQIYGEDPYKQVNNQFDSADLFDPLTNSAKSEGRVNNLTQMRLKRDPSKTQANMMKSEFKKSQKEGSASQIKNSEIETMKSTAAQSHEPRVNIFAPKMSQKEKIQLQKMQEASKIERSYNKNMEKQILCRQIRDRLRKEFHAMYRNAEIAYAALDYTGLGYITEDAFMKSQIISRRIPFTSEEVRLYFIDYNIFNKDSPGIDFDTFKKNFFPHLYLVGDPADDEADIDAQKNRNELKQHGDKYNLIIEKRVQKLEGKLKEKFSNCFESVRKAFLALDSDFDGFITVEDILKYFGTDTDLNYNELKKLMNDKDSKKQGRINYPDFSKWLGNTIHMPQGFYFRHDSVLNPNYEKQIEKQLKSQKTQDTNEVSKILLGEDLEHKILEKIKFQWKTIRKAFQDMNVSKTGKISKDEFKFYLQFWGINITEEKFLKVFAKFDLDQDGALSYKDFQSSIGAEMFPAEGLYFRQDKTQQCSVNTCKQSECWQPTKNTVNFCDVHQKMHEGQAVQKFSKIFKQLGPKWASFISELKRTSDKDDESQIYFKLFVDIVCEFGGQLSQEEFSQILMAFPGKEGGTRGKRIDIGRIYDQKYFQMLQKVYNRMDFAITGGEDEPMDDLGYIGKTIHEREKTGPLQPISHGEFIYAIYKSNKLKEIMFDISQIDNHTGVVTKNELDDIMKLHYPDKFKDKDLKPIISMFSSIQNKILIDHQKFRDWILKGLAKIELKIEKKRLMSKKLTKLKDSQVTTQELMQMQNQTLLQHLQNNEQVSQQSHNKNSSMVQQRQINMKDALWSQSLDANHASASKLKQRPSSSSRVFHSRRASGTVSIDPFNSNADQNQYRDPNSSDLIGSQNVKLKRPNSSMSSSAYNSRVIQANYNQRARVAGTQLVTNRGNEGNEYVTIKDLIKNDQKDYFKNRKSSASRNAVNKTMLTNFGLNDFDTGKSSQINYNSNNSVSNLRRRPYTSINRHQSNERQENLANSMNVNQQKQTTGQQIHSKSRRDLENNDFKNTYEQSNGSLNRTLSESKLLLNYTNSKLMPTSDQMMKRLINFSLEKDLDRTNSRRSRDKNTNHNLVQYLNTDMNDYNQLENTPAGMNKGGHETNSEEDQYNSNYYTPFDQSVNEQQIEKSLLYDAYTNKFRNSKRSESLNRATLRDFQNDFNNSSQPRIYQKRNSSIEQMHSNTYANRFDRNPSGLHSYLDSKKNSITSLRLKMSMTPKGSNFGYNIPKALSTSDQQMIINKLAYEWKNIFRAIIKVNTEKGQMNVLGSSEFVTLKDFDAACDLYGVHFTREQIQKIEKCFQANKKSKRLIGSDQKYGMKSVINFVALSHVLGLHKDSYNYMGSHSLSNVKSKSYIRLYKDRQSIDPVVEEPSTIDQKETDYREEIRMRKRRQQSFENQNHQKSLNQKYLKLKPYIGSQKLSTSTVPYQDTSGRNQVKQREQIVHLTAVTEEEAAKYDKDSQPATNRDQPKTIKRLQKDIKIGRSRQQSRLKQHLNDDTGSRQQGLF